MFVYLSKKIAIPNNIKLRCVSYNRQDGFVACGGNECLLKVLKLETKIENPKVRGIAASSNLTMNQPLEGHKGSVTVLAWNEKYQKLTTGDQHGLIIVWMLHKGMWFEEMVNNRSKSVVRGMRWSTDGTKICIAYEDGAVILGSVDGNRIWGKELKTQLALIEWSPNSRQLLFGVSNGEVHIYDASGDFMSPLKIYCQTKGSSSKLAAIEWYSGAYGYAEPNCPCLVICYENGHCQLMRSEVDEEPVLMDTGLQLCSAKWNHNGTVFAAAGQRPSEGEVNYVYFYSPFGELLRTLKVPGKELTSISWEGGSLRLALAVDFYIYFANIRPAYQWAYFADTVAYSFTKPDHVEHVVVFLNTKTKEKSVRHVKNFLSISACGDFCCIVSRSEDSTVQQQFSLTLCNSIGTPLESKFIDLTPSFVAMTGSHIVVASREAFYMWQFKHVKQRVAIEVSGRLKAGTEKLYHIDDVPSGLGGEAIDFSKAQISTQDHICAVTVSDKVLAIARESGALNMYAMPSLSLTNKLTIKPFAYQLSFNSTSSRLAIIDSAGILTLMNIDTKLSTGTGAESTGEIKFERKDVWQVKWAEDNENMFAAMEKTRLFIFCGIEAEEPVSSSGYICQFKDLQATSVLLDDIMMDPEKVSEDNIIVTEAKSLRDLRSNLETIGIEEALKVVEANPHPRLWQLLAEYSLDKLNLNAAEHAFVRSKDYSGIQLVKRLSNLQNDKLKRAEVAAYFGNYGEAEKLYVELDRRDLAVSLRKRLGDWLQVVHLLKTSSAGDDFQMEEAFNAIGNYFADRQKWKDAVQYYTQGRNQERLAKCYYMLEDYSGLKTMSSNLPDNHKLLPEIAQMFVTVGMCKEAVDAFVRCGNVKEAIDTCISLNQWNTAIELARAHNVQEVEPLLVKYAETLLDRKKVFSAVELYRQANQHLSAAKLLFEIAQKEAQLRSSPLRIKKLFLLAGLLVEQHHEHMRSTHRAKTKKRTADAMATLAGLLEEDVSAMSETKVIDSAWRGAEAYHFYILAQKQLYEGLFESAMKTALQLREYEDIIPPLEIYSLLALVSAAVRAFGLCSKAFIKLESLENVSPEQQQQFQDLAIQIFTRQPPKDFRVNKVECPSCAASMPDTCTSCPGCNTKFPACIVTGRPLLQTQFWQCSVCKRAANPKDIQSHRACVLCHSPI